MLASCMPNYSEGERHGVVVKLSRKGAFFKSWEGEAVMGGTKQKTTAHYDSKGEYNGSTTSNVANVFEFNVDEACVKKVQAAMESGQPARLVYRQWFWRPPTIENSYVVVDVK